MPSLHAICLVLLAVAITSGPAPAFGQDLPRTHEIYVDDYFTLGTPSTLAVSPDGAATSRE